MISVYGLNSFGRDEVRGNGAIHLPIAPGRCVDRIVILRIGFISLLQNPLSFELQRTCSRFEGSLLS